MVAGVPVNEPTSPKFGVYGVTDSPRSELSPVMRHATLRPTSPSIFQDDMWDVSAEDKATFDRYFDSLDTTKKGFLTGEEAAGFFMKSNLPPVALAQIWDLADIEKSGRLSRDEFAVGMHLITKKLVGVQLPAVLPPSLIPPSMRSSQAVSSPFTEILKRSGTISSVQKSNFTPARSRSISNQYSSASDLLFDTNISNTLPTPFASQSQNSNDIDLLGDTDISTQMAIEGGEIRNLKMQADNLDVATTELKNKRSSFDANLVSLATQKSEISVRISQLRTLYDAELKSLQEVQAKYQLEHESVERAREELAQVERSMASLKQEKEQLEVDILRDREETLNIKKRMRVAEEENIAIKAEIEKLKKDSKQQKGLLAINKEQLASVEVEKDKSLKILQSMEVHGTADASDPFGSGTFTPPIFGQSNNTNSMINSQSGSGFEDGNYQPKSFNHSQHASISSLSGAGVRRTMSNASLASNSTLGTSSIKSAPPNSSKLEEITFDKPIYLSSSKSTELENLFDENLSSTPQEINQLASGSGTMAQNVNPFENTFSSSTQISKESAKPLQAQNVEEKETEKINADPFSSFGSSVRSTSGKAGFDLAFSSISLPNNDNTTTTDSFTTDFPSLEEIEASVEGGVKLGFDNDFTSFSDSVEKKDEDGTSKEKIVDGKVGYSTAVETSANEPEIFTVDTSPTPKGGNEAEKKGIDESFAVTITEQSLPPAQDADAWVSIENTTDSKIIKDIKDDFEAAFGDLNEVKVTKTSPIDFDAGFDDADFEEDFKFNPTFETPVTQTKPIVPAASSGTNNASSFTNTSSIDFDKAFSDFDPFSSSTSPLPNTAKPNLDAAFGGAPGEASKSTDNNFFDNTFSDLFGAPSSKADPPLVETQPSTITSIPPIPQLPLATSTTPGDIDNMNPVKRLQLMGFSREQSEDALERYDYDLEKASNFLVENLIK
ncbi:13735_t:CDS:2 [Acaulospora colombiana]|uniref:13735_t:CDS:1 n=1 Tax=Acaulospora colombiana TaxID=27376 RepID=A0ACA9K683_9GLOM|nr:13735_t:CDS:2 [Acaulospora colombiana]